LVAPAGGVRPVLRPAKLKVASPDVVAPSLSAGVALFAASEAAVAQSLRPNVRSAGIVARAQEVRAARVRGQVCGDPAIQGDAIGRISGRGACGVENAVRVRSVAGVTLRPTPTIDCRTAGALKAWVAQGAKPAVGQIGGGISSLRVVSHYACRFRNSASTFGARDYCADRLGARRQGARVTRHVAGGVWTVRDGFGARSEPVSQGSFPL